MDYVCPFSAKMALAIDSVLVPLFSAGGRYDGKVKVIFRNQVQPWHASSTFVHEAGLAVRIASPLSPHSLRQNHNVPRRGKILPSVLSVRELMLSSCARKAGLLCLRWDAGG